MTSSLWISRWTSDIKEKDGIEVLPSLRTGVQLTVKITSYIFLVRYEGACCVCVCVCVCEREREREREKGVTINCDLDI